MKRLYLKIISLFSLLILNFNFSFSQNADEVVITGVNLFQPVYCKEPGYLVIRLENAVEAELFEVNLNDDAVFENSTPVQNSSLTILNLQPGSVVSNVKIRQTETDRVLSLSYQDTVKSPALPMVTLPDLGPYCVNSGTKPVYGNFPGGTLFIDGTPSVSVNTNSLSPGIHQLVYVFTDDNRCTNSDTSVLYIKELPETGLQDTTYLCPGTSEKLFVVEEIENYLYFWEVSGGEILGENNRPFINIRFNGYGGNRLTLHVTDKSSGCIDSAEMAIIFSDTLPPVYENCAAKIILPVERDNSEWLIDLSKSIFTDIYSVTDNCSDNPAITFSVNGGELHELPDNMFHMDTLQYMLIKWLATDESGNQSECISETQFEFSRLIPSAFSPCNDPPNNEWEIDFLFEYPGCSVQVYNRWGLPVFESKKGYIKPWDGKKKNGDCVPPDSYYYIISTGENDLSIQGIVTVIY